MAVEPHKFVGSGMYCDLCDCVHGDPNHFGNLQDQQSHGTPDLIGNNYPQLTIRDVRRAKHELYGPPSKPKIFWRQTIVPMPAWCRLIDRAMFWVCKKWYKK